MEMDMFNYKIVMYLMNFLFYVHRQPKFQRNFTNIDGHTIILTLLRLLKSNMIRIQVGEIKVYIHFVFEDKYTLISRIYYYKRITLHIYNYIFTTQTMKFKSYK